MANHNHPRSSKATPAPRRRRLLPRDVLCIAEHAFASNRRESRLPRSGSLTLRVRRLAVSLSRCRPPSPSERAVDKQPSWFQSQPAHSPPPKTGEASSDNAATHDGLAVVPRPQPDAHIASLTSAAMVADCPKHPPFAPIACAVQMRGLGEGGLCPCARQSSSVVLLCSTAIPALGTPHRCLDCETHDRSSLPTCASARPNLTLIALWHDISACQPKRVSGVAARLARSAVAYLLVHSSSTAISTIYNISSRASSSWSS
ncbi:uncharacterized protein CC84DRAFT_656127 [Paraphaeosphaeria sporulosa]|uniref:Uncharacterized protein n=1 Tax=Paraphaeosphaeria sporulosa TaxID=1460663 RepID=A0A177CKU6_9PLEO|nr:uncharacterized protein CC84DRAFT_656127 [Paraphaeosphaeria sporulosa]OAG07417.1 hypothetical protein CC84DRAFT_656127 [Paraphaeosphaeria sporulosa]